MAPEIIDPKESVGLESVLVQFTLQKSAAGQDFGIEDLTDGWQIDFFGNDGHNVARKFAISLDEKLRYNFTKANESAQFSKALREIERDTVGADFSLRFSKDELIGVKKQEYTGGSNLQFERYFFRFSSQKVLVNTIIAIGNALSQKVPSRTS